jgi:peptidoglycan/xylan/chitin deacetylase (PgdA/CDA1 family)
MPKNDSGTTLLRRPRNPAIRATLSSGRKEVIASLLVAARAPALSRWLQRRRLTILMFHGVEAEPLSPPCPYVNDAATLRRQLEYVRRYFHVLPLEEALERLYAGSLPDRAAAITFDDGTRNLLTHAAPVLRDLGLPAAVFLATGPMGTDETLWPDRLWLAFARTKVLEVDLTVFGLGTVSLRSDADRGAARAAVVRRLKDSPDEERMARVESLIAMLEPDLDGDAGPFRMLSWEEAHALAGDGNVTLHPHSVTHPILSRCSDEKVEWEIVESCARLERETGSMPSVFAYPNGGPEDFDERARAALLGRGIRWALATTSGLASRKSDPLAMPRIGIGNGQSDAVFQLVVSGALWWFKELPAASKAHFRRALDRIRAARSGFHGH